MLRITRIARIKRKRENVADAIKKMGIRRDLTRVSGGTKISTRMDEDYADYADEDEKIRR